jgi:hypothetical protein
LHGVTGKGLWLGGTLSPLARQELEKAGWTVNENAEHLVAVR